MTFTFETCVGCGYFKACQLFCPTPLFAKSYRNYILPIFFYFMRKFKNYSQKALDVFLKEFLCYPGFANNRCSYAHPHNIPTKSPRSRLSLNAVITLFCRSFLCQTMFFFLCCLVFENMKFDRNVGPTKCYFERENKFSIGSSSIDSCLAICFWAFLLEFPCQRFPQKVVGHRK